MTRYVTRADKPLYIETPLWEDQQRSLTPDISVDGRKEVDTGLVTACGKSIFRIAPPVGFGRDGEW